MLAYMRHKTHIRNNVKLKGIQLAVYIASLYLIR